jgi:thioesterase domain-containing protein
MTLGVSTRSPVDSPPCGCNYDDKICLESGMDLKSHQTGRRNEPTEPISRDALELSYEFVPAGSSREDKLCKAFSGVFNVFPVGVDDDFFDLGGDSLLGEQLSIEIEREIGRTFPISQIFEHGTPRRIAALLGAGLPADTVRHQGDDVLFVVHGRGGYMALRPEFHKAITSGLRLHMFELPGIRGDGPRMRSIDDVAAIYVQQVQRMQPEGPVRLASFCAGGLIALAMAAQLEDAGRKLDRIVLVDPRMPKRVNRRHRAEQRLAASKPGLAATLRYFMATGRSPASSFLEPLLRAVEFRWAQHREMRRIERDRQKGVRFAGRYDGLGLKDAPRAALVAAYRFAWPRPFVGKVHILASRDRYKSFSDPAEAWDRFAPNRIAEIVIEHHSDIGSESASLLAKRIDEILSPLAAARPLSDA